MEGKSAIVFVSYLHKSNMDVYSIKGQEIKKVDSGNLDSIKPLTGWGKKILIVGKDMLLFTRKRFPPTTSENIAKAIKMDIKEMFPIKDPAFSFKIFEQTATYSLANIWAWDCSNYEEIRKIFPFTHILPEDATFMSEEPEITVFEENGLKHLVAHNRDGFLGGLSLRNFTDKGFETFLRSLGRYANNIKTIRSYISEKQLNFPATFQIVHEEQKDYAPCLKDVMSLNLKDFRFSHEMPFNFNIEQLARVIICCLIAYSISLFIAGRNYESAINETKAKIIDLKNELPMELQTDDIYKYSDVISALQKKRKTRVDALAIMDILAEFIPEGSYVNKLTLNENRLELNLSSATPIDVIESLSGAKCVKTVRLNGSPAKRRNTLLYTFLLTIELKSCR